DRAVGAADGFADANFADAFGDAGQHDVHNADAAHDEADAGDQSAAQAGVANGLADVVRPILGGVYLKILDALVGDQHGIASLLDGRPQHFDFRHADINPVNHQRRDVGGIAPTSPLMAGPQ